MRLTAKRSCFACRTPMRWLFERGLHDPKLPRLLPKAALAKLREEVETARGLCPQLAPEAYPAGHLTAVYFGSALTDENSALIGTGDREFIRSRTRALALLRTPENTIFCQKGMVAAPPTAPVREGPDALSEPATPRVL